MQGRPPLTGSPGGTGLGCHHRPKQFWGLLVPSQSRAGVGEEGCPGGIYRDHLARGA